MTDPRKKYEAMFLLDNATATAETSQGVGIVTDLLSKHGANIVKVGVWDERKLAYPIAGQKRGTYVLAHFELEPRSVAQVTHDVNIAENILRAMVTAVDGEFPVFRTHAEMEALRPRRDPAEGRRRRDEETEEDEPAERPEPVEEES
jgi:ribosomal protein S6